MRRAALVIAFATMTGLAIPPSFFSPPPSAAQVSSEGEVATSSEADGAALDSPDTAGESVGDTAGERDLKARAKSLYAYLRGKRVNIYSLYQSEVFRDFFTTEEALENYIAYLTSRLEQRRFRKYRIEDTELVELTARGPDRARAKVKLIGRHRQPFIFWDKTDTIENEWRRLDGVWFVFPPPF